MASEISYVNVVCRVPLDKQGMVVEQNGDYAHINLDGKITSYELALLTPAWESTFMELLYWWDKKAAALRAEEILTKYQQHRGNDPKVLKLYEQIIAEGK